MTESEYQEIQGRLRVKLKSPSNPSLFSGNKRSYFDEGILSAMSILHSMHVGGQMLTSEAPLTSLSSLLGVNILEVFTFRGIKMVVGTDDHNLSFKPSDRNWFTRASSLDVLFVFFNSAEIVRGDVVNEINHD